MYDYVKEVIENDDFYEMSRFRYVPGYEDLFRVNMFGDVRSVRTGILYSKVLSKSGYWTLPTRLNGRNGTNLTTRVHRLIAKTFIPNPENKSFVNHIDGIKTNNFVSNLEWVTPRENNEHAIRLGLWSPESFIRHGEDNHSSKLTADDVKWIRDNFRVWKKDITIKDLMEKYNVSRWTIRSVIIGEYYKEEKVDRPIIKYSSKLADIVFNR